MLKIRLTRLGDKKSPFYRVVVADSHAPRDGKFIEILGTFDPLVQENAIKIDKEKTLEWIKKGAIPTDTARATLVRAGILEPIPYKPKANAKPPKVKEKKKK